MLDAMARTKHQHGTLQNMVLVLFLTVICQMSVDSESAGSVQRNVSAVEGETVSLLCEAPNQETIRAVEWSRPDLGENPEVFLHRDGHTDPNNHPSYKNRTDLKDRTMKDGDVSLILKNVTSSDSGTFECYVIQGGEESRKKRSASDMKLACSVSLSVVPPPGDTGGQGGSGGHVGLIAGLTVAALVGVGIFGVVMFLRHQKKKKKSPPPDSDSDHDKSLNQGVPEKQT